MLFPTEVFSFHARTQKDQAAAAAAAAVVSECSVHFFFISQ
jgi:hypothetical protein